MVFLVVYESDVFCKSSEIRIIKKAILKNRRVFFSFVIIGNTVRMIGIASRNFI